MANLIITVISIALVAVAALMGAYYGGTAFMEGQAKAKANTLINQAEQISAATQLYITNRGGSKTYGFYLTDLVPNYLTSVPVNSFALDEIKLTGTDGTDIMAPAIASAEHSIFAVFIPMAEEHEKICNNINLIGRNTATHATYSDGELMSVGGTETISIANGLQGARFNCYKHDASGFAGSPYFVFLYRIF